MQLYKQVLDPLVMCTGPTSALAMVAVKLGIVRSLVTVERNTAPTV